MAQMIRRPGTPGTLLNNNRGEKVAPAAWHKSWRN